MTHDPLCPAPLCDWTGKVGTECMGYEDCWHDCQCTFIAKVRDDERAATFRDVIQAVQQTLGTVTKAIEGLRND